jgi:hypothetical protein
MGSSEMVIKKNGRGWQIEPSTSDEEKALLFLLNALEARYGSGVEAKVNTEGAVKAIDLHVPVPSHRTVALV